MQSMDIYCLFCLFALGAFVIQATTLIWLDRRDQKTGRKNTIIFRFGLFLLLFSSVVICLNSVALGVRSGVRFGRGQALSISDIVPNKWYLISGQGKVGDNNKELATLALYEGEMEEKRDWRIYGLTSGSLKTDEDTGFVRYLCNDTNQENCHWEARKEAKNK